jgi:hypothetical protein
MLKRVYNEIPGLKRRPLEKHREAANGDCVLDSSSPDNTIIGRHAAAICNFLQARLPVPILLDYLASARIARNSPMCCNTGLICFLIE